MDEARNTPNSASPGPRLSEAQHARNQVECGILSRLSLFHPLRLWRGAVRGDPNSPNWLRVSTVFLLACLVSCACMRLLVRHHAELRTATFGIVYLVSGLVGSWLTLRAWRRYRSTQCVFALGLFSGLGGSGLYMAL
jgi:hypothetical protein